MSFDLAIIGGGINGCGIARDAAGRGLKVLLLEQGDLAQATSSASTKLIHGGLRYLEHYEFRLVREALVEREVLLAAMPHIIWPLRFVLPHHAGLRPAWMLRLGLLPLRPSRRAEDPAGDADARPAPRPGGGAAQAGLPQGLRVFRLLGRRRAARGAERPRRGGARGGRSAPAPASSRPAARAAAGGCGSSRRRRSSRARAVVNAGGPWVGEVIREGFGGESAARVRLVRGSHIVMRELFDHDRAYIFQQADGRMFFAIPYEGDFTLIGTTDVEHDGAPGEAACTRGGARLPARGGRASISARRSASATSSGAIPACGRSTTTGRARPRRRRGTM